MPAPTKVAPRDQNNVPCKMAVLNTDTVQGTNLVPIAIDGVLNGISLDTTSTISFTMQPLDPRDPNYVNVWAFEGADGKVYPAVATSAGALLVNMI